MNVVVSNIITLRKGMEQPPNMLVCTRFEQNSKVGCVVLTSNIEAYDKGECMRKAIGAVERLRANIESPRPM